MKIYWYAIHLLVFNYKIFLWAFFVLIGLLIIRLLITFQPKKTTMWTIFLRHSSKSTFNITFYNQWLGATFSKRGWVSLPTIYWEGPFPRLLCFHIKTTLFISFTSKHMELTRFNVCFITQLERPTPYLLIKIQSMFMAHSYLSTHIYIYLAKFIKKVPARNK